MKKRTVALLTSICLLVALVGCGGGTVSSSTASEPAPSAAGSSAETSSKPAEQTSASTPGSDEPLNVYLVSPLVGGAAWGICEIGFKAACEELGWNGTYVGPTNVASVVEMVDLAETAISNGADILIGAWNDQEAYLSTLERAKEKGITILGINYSIEGFTEAYLGIDPDKLGQVQAETLHENFPADEQIHLVYMQGRLDSQSHVKNYKAFEARLAELRPDAEIVAWEECHSNVQEANEKMSALILANPQINAFVANDGNGAIGVSALVQERGLEAMYVQAIDGGGEILENVLAGYLDCTVIQDWYNVGYQGAMLAQKVHNKESVDYFSGMGAYALYADGVEKYAADNGISIG